jgi:hypothetical protein
MILGRVFAGISTFANCTPRQRIARFIVLFAFGLMAGLFLLFFGAGRAGALGTPAAPVLNPVISAATKPVDAAAPGLTTTISSTVAPVAPVVATVTKQSPRSSPP